MKGLRSSLFFSAVDKYASTTLSIAMTAVAARLLTPGDIGVFAIASLVAVLAEALRDFGASVYIVQSHTLTRQTLRTAFTLMAGMSLAIALILVAASGSIAVFYADARVAPAIVIAAAGVIVASLAAPSLAILRREMRFRALAVANVSAPLANLLAFLAFYAAGWGYLSLVLASLVAGTVLAATAILAVRRFWMFLPSLAEWRAIVSFGTFASATAVLNIFYSSLPQMLLGRLIGLDAVGFYSRATMLCQLPDRLIVGALQPVILPAFAERSRSGGDLKVAYLRALSFLSAVQWPALAVLAIMAGPAVRLALGPQWDACAPLLRIMALAWLVMMPASLTYPILVASGRIRDTLTSTLISLPVSALAVILSAPFGLEALAWSMFVTLPFQMWVAFVFIRRQIGFAWGELAGALSRSAVVTACTVAGPILLMVHAGFDSGSSFAMPATGLLAAAAGWLGGLRLTEHPLLSEFDELRRFVNLAVAKLSPRGRSWRNLPLE